MRNSCLLVFLSNALFLGDPAAIYGQPAPNPDNIIVVFANRFPQGGISICIQINPHTYFPQLVGLPAVDAPQPITIPEGLVGRLNQQALTAVDAIDQACELSDEQKQKFLLAAKLDQHALLRRLKRFADAIGCKPFDQLEDTTKIVRQIGDFRTAIETGPNRSGTLFAKLLESQLSSAQRSKLTDEHILAFTDAASRTAVLSNEQRQVLLDVLSAKAIEVGDIVNRQYLGFMA